uniref:Protein kinase domain-containing protein n=1 Tax=Oryza brachyantha TaxID=4533 RepID=J3MWS7_ORYBR
MAAPAVGQPGYLSIDCGLDANSSYQDDNKIIYVGDDGYVDGGENHKVSPAYLSKFQRPHTTLRSFPTGKRNCYTLPTTKFSKYLLRLVFVYGDYDGKKSSAAAAAPQFDLYLGLSRWATVHDTGGGGEVHEAMFVAWASWAPVCLVSTGGGTPFVSSVELRPLADSMYPGVMTNQSLVMYRRYNMAANVFIRYPDDLYDRYWWPMQQGDPTWANLSTTSAIRTGTTFAVPSSVLQTAVAAAAPAPAGNSSSSSASALSVKTWQDTSARSYAVFLHFADFQSSRLRQFDAYPDAGQVVYNFTPSYLAASTVYSPLFRAAGGVYNITLAATAKSALPPMLNAFEIYYLLTYDGMATFSNDFDAIMAIKLEYGIKKNWMGDPCLPLEFAWSGVTCSNISGGNNMRIISLDLSNSNLSGVISNKFTQLTALEKFYGSDGNTCNKIIISRNRTAIIAVSVVVPVLVVIVLVIAYFIWRVRRKPNNSSYVPPPVPDTKISPEIPAVDVEPLPISESRQFTYEELKKFTNNFSRFIGKGGFGSVYYGCLENSTEIAVKVLSEFSANGLGQFLAEVQNLTKVHHRNLVSLVGYCWEKDHLALAYEYMAGGNLCDYLKVFLYEGRIGVNWATRVRIVLEAAQGLEYLHKGCNLPIIHGDMKTNNVLLGENLKAKIADFGLSRTYVSETQTHISTINAGGTIGYIDPEYYRTGRLTESSDVYSFGVVLLEVVTGEPPILPGRGHITKWVKESVASGNINLVADARLKDSYDISSMWKVVDTAMQCTTQVAAQRPTMSTVVLHLKDSLALEEAHDDRHVTASSVGDAIELVSTFGPSARMWYFFDGSLLQGYNHSIHSGKMSVGVAGC